MALFELQVMKQQCSMEVFLKADAHPIDPHVGSSLHADMPKTLAPDVQLYDSAMAKTEVAEDDEYIVPAAEQAYIVMAYIVMAVCSYGLYCFVG